ncbi:hypothetical protein A2303_06825 [Candidatus Falkowbacteria bacterium RIFOXYB2_FULL_47_14]|uniref:Major facilitator superfamily (MFS) profile domain-containing protein n=1 Tax=Candidatus Falkowbacteria bacterium RIFOXYA2_FULL_47_19 TaxID=1797994 RepID=A0A1F5SGK3_9BACT|nr:MAG: hypothetical protein A2227_00570 [Candidatus Falkowbacteria bacterium RIFOXYA2_FULL_47_19]OGF35507.1 MAG: hypothetical protein A2468_05700 [Candidatus Falkowbacteria bacterium RIFOXYC2_FULL_46_15]OGF43583.1 MAG: hypothetical protein A2303_06825 [Candidatus Falkowbacteria bacterium RIFOXYB2_FULL_47_14]
MAKKKILAVYYGFEFIINLGMSFFFSTYTVFLLFNGLNLWQVNLINASFMLSGALFEVPTGSIADNYGRKLSFVLSCFTAAGSMFIYYFSSTFTWFVIAEIIAALGMSFCSGAFDAWAIDSLDLCGESFCLNKLASDKEKIRNLSRIIGTVFGAYIGAINIALPWLVSGITILICGVLAIFLIDESYFQARKKADPERTGLKRIIKDSCDFGLKNRSIFFLGLSAMAYSFTCMPFNMYWQPFFRDGFSVPVVALGWVHGASLIILYLGNEFAGRFGNKFKKEKYAIILGLVVFAVSAIAAALSPVLFAALIGFYGHEFARGFYAPIQNAYLNRRIPGRVRATVQSFVSMLEGVAAFLGLIASGWIAQNYGVPASWTVAGSFLLLSVLFLGSMKNGE